MEHKKNIKLMSSMGVGFFLIFALNVVSPGHGYVSVPAAAFRPMDHRYTYANQGYRVVNLDDEEQDWAAPVQLPSMMAKLSRVEE